MLRRTGVVGGDGACRGGAVALQPGKRRQAPRLGKAAAAARRLERHAAARPAGWKRRAFVATFKAIVINRTATGQTVALTDLTKTI